MSGDPKMAEGVMIADRYRILRVLGEGGMGVVYAAEHVLMRKEVALKVLHGEMCTMPEIVARFEREAIAAAHIDHPNVAGATDFGRLPDGACYLVLELLKGASLRDEVAKGPIPLERALVILRGIANGMAAAHTKGIVHRDLKPENVMLVERDGMPDFVKVLDFGIAKLDASVAHATPQEGQNIVTRVGTIFGTPEYMAPEQAVGDKVDARADIFALGVVFLEMLTGKCPFRGEILNVLRERIMMTTPLDFTGITNDDVKALIAKMLQRHADDRVQSASELLAAIDAIEASPLPVTSTTVPAVVTDSKPALAMNTSQALSAVARPKWLVPAAAVASAVALMLVVIGVAASGSSATNSKTTVVHHGVGKVTSKQAPPAVTTPAATGVPEKAPEPEPEPTQAAEPAPEPSASAAAIEPDPDPSASAAPTPSHIRPAEQKPAQRRRRTGPGGIYIPPPKDWFK